jgi:hypothetical protein
MALFGLALAGKPMAWFIPSHGRTTAETRSGKVHLMEIILHKHTRKRHNVLRSMVRVLKNVNGEESDIDFKLLKAF